MRFLRVATHRFDVHFFLRVGKSGCTAWDVFPRCRVKFARLLFYFMFLDVSMSVSDFTWSALLSVYNRWVRCLVPLFKCALAISLVVVKFDFA